jgi:tetratricopeptide (TPR) repeat protein
MTVLNKRTGNLEFRIQNSELKTQAYLISKFSILNSLLLIAIVFLVMACGAALAASTGELLQQGLYAEEVEGNIDSAIKSYQQVIDNKSAPRNHVAQALYRQGMCYLKTGDEQSARAALEKLVTEYADQNEIVEKARPSLEDLMNFDPAALMPANTLIYVELGSPGKQVETILNMLKGTPYENPLAAVGGKQAGQKTAGDIVGALLNPSMLAEFKKIRGGAVGITGTSQGNPPNVTLAYNVNVDGIPGISQKNPPMIAVLYPGKSDALRGIIMAALNMAGGPDEPIEGMQTINIQNTTWVAYDDRVILVGMPKEQLVWCIKQYKGLIKEPTLASSNPAFSKISKQQRQNNTLTVWANVDEEYAQLCRQFPPGKVPKGIIMANTICDFNNIDYLTYNSTVEKDGFADVTEIVFKDGHNCLAYDLFRTPNISKSALEAVPCEAIAIVSFALNEPESIQANTIRAKVKNITGLDIGREIFANIEQVTIFAMPSDINASVSLLPDKFGVEITSRNPEQTRRILTTLLATVNTMITGQPTDVNTGKFQIGMTNNQKQYCYMNQSGKVTVLSLNRKINDAALSAIKNKKSVCTDGPLADAVSKLPPSASKLVVVNAGSGIRLAAPFILTKIPQEQRGAIAGNFEQIATAADKTTYEFRSDEQLNDLTISSKLSGLPPLNQVVGPITQIAKTMQKAKTEAKAKELKRATPATIIPATRPPVIDGNEDAEWSSAPQYKLANVIESFSSGEAFSPPKSPNDLSAEYRAMWDESNLYLLIDVTDDVLSHNPAHDQSMTLPSGSAAVPWFYDDSIEVFIDADNSKSNQYDNDDAQYYFRWDKTNPKMGVQDQHGRLEGVEFAMVTTDKGYRTEIKFPWTTLGKKPATGMSIGFDVQVNDSDSSGKRERKIAWFGKQDDSWQNPQKFGNAELAGLIIWWKFDETEGTVAKDSSGGNHNGTLVGNAKWATGKIGGAIDLEGKSGYVKIADKSVFDIGGQITIACWVNFRSIPNDYTAIVTKGDNSWRLSTVQRENRLHASVNDYQKIGLDGNAEISLNQWHHAAMVYDGQKLCIYIDGKVDSCKPWTGGIGKNDFDVLIGENAEQKGRFFDGLIDDVRIYNYALSANEIAALAAGQ